MMWIRAGLLLLTCHLPGMLAARQPLMQWYTVNEGLPSSQVYQVLQDHEGFIWCSTGNGIARFDGTSFVSFSTADGFPDRGAYHMVADSRGRIWFLTFSGKVCYYAKGGFHLPEIPLVKNDFVRWIEEMPDGRLLFLTNTGSVIMQWPDGRYRRYQVAAEPLFHGQLYGDDSLIIASTSYQCLQLSTGKVTDLEIPRQENRRFIRVLSLAPRKLLLTADKGFYRLEHGQLRYVPLGTEVMPEQVAALVNTNGDLWVSTYGGALRFAGGQLDEAHMEPVLQGHGVTSIICDHEGNLWFSVFNEGICMLPRQFTSLYNRENGLPPDRNVLCVVAGNDQRVYAVATTGQVFRLDSMQAVLSGRLPLPTPQAEVVTAWGTETDVVFSTGNLYCRMRDGVISMCSESMNTFFRFSTYAPSGPGCWIIPHFTGNGTEIREFDERTEEFTTRWKQDTNTAPEYMACTFMLAGDPAGGYWMGTRQGPVYLEPGGSMWFAAEKYPALRATVTSLAYDAAGKTWVGTATGGVFCLDGKKMIAHYTTAGGLPGNCCNSLCADNVEGMWACTNAGLAWLRPGHTMPVTVFRSPEMLPGHEALSMCKIGHRVYVATTKGIGSFMDNAQQLPDVFPPVYISGVSVDGQKRGVHASYEFEPGQNNIELNFTAIAFRKNGAMRYRYQLEGADTGWSYTTNGHLQYRSLPPGTYTFRVFAINTAGLGSKIPAMITFTIPPSWWQTWWFRTSVALLLGGALFAVMYLRARAVRRTARVRQMFLETRLQALRAQINPHFVFNALNSVQSFIFSRQPELANEYLVNFARMMRMISEGAEKETILLREEIAFLRNYITVEKLRFDNDFEYSIDIAPGVDTESFRIPSMILQPVIENAFKHGLSAKEGPKRLLVRFSGEANRLCVCIEDNGVGRMPRPVVDELGKTALGIANVRQRLLLLQGKGRKTEPVRITDLYEDGRPSGVRVELTILLPVKKQVKQKTT